MQQYKTPVIIVFLSIVVFTFSACGSGKKSTEDNQADPTQYTDAESYIDALQFSGTILVKKEDREIVRKSVGYADKAAQIPNSDVTRFRIGSSTKTFTAFAVVQLKNAGLLDYDDTLSTYIPEFNRADEITIRHLLTHRSGISEYADTDIINDNQSYTPWELISLIKEKALDFEPGSKFTYSNANYLLLGYIIEMVSGTDYGSFIDANITTPLGMHDTEISPRHITEEPYAKGYEDITQNRLAPFHDISIPNAAGALSSTIKDMEIWADSFYDSNFISQEDKAEIFAGDTYGFGWILSSIGGKKAYWHNGGISGFSAIVVLLPEQEGVIIILSNIDNAHDQLNKIVSTLIENEF